MVSEVAVKMLTHLGYKSEVARDGAEAITLYREALESGNPFDIVIMDLTIPGGMGGVEAIRKLLEIDPGIKAVVSSGYSNDPVMSDYTNYGFKGCIVKPYKVFELGEVIRQVLN
jgi:two-component system, cell cycle sensor histidine kinase and response regulator CckA